ncbi:hypothetical protein MRX96_046024, partial [Rhipicephalus microplus]
MVPGGVSPDGVSSCRLHDSPGSAASSFTLQRGHVMSSVLSAPSGYDGRRDLTRLCFV